MPADVISDVLAHHRRGGPEAGVDAAGAGGGVAHESMDYRQDSLDVLFGGRTA